MENQKPLTVREKRGRRLNSLNESLSNLSQTRITEENEKINKAIGSPLQEAAPIISMGRQKVAAIQHERNVTNELAYHLLSESLADVVLKALPLSPQYVAGKESVIHENAKEMFKQMFKLGTLQLNTFSLNESLLVRDFTRAALLQEENGPNLELLVEEAAKAIEEKVKEALKEEISAAKERTKREESLKKASSDEKEDDKEEDKEEEETPKEEENENTSEGSSDSDDSDDISELDDEPEEGSTEDKDGDADKEKSDDDKKEETDKESDKKSEDDNDDDKKKKEDKEEDDKKAEPLEESYSVSLSVFPALVGRNTRFNSKPSLMGGILHECAKHQYVARAEGNFTKVDYNDVLAEAVINYTFIETLNTMRVLSPETSLRMLKLL